MIFKKYFYRKQEEKKNNKNIESVDKNNLKMLKFYINGGKALCTTMYIKNRQ
jgi:hypothetical protein